MQNANSSTEMLLKEIVAAYKATQDKPLDTPDHIKHLRYQIARLARVCIEQDKRIRKLEMMLDIMPEKKKQATRENNKAEQDLPAQITALGDII